MIATVRAEFRKLFSTQVWFWMLVAALLVTGLFVIGQLASSNGVQSYHDAIGVFTTGGTAYVVVFVLGVLSVTTEYRYQTITPTVLATPSRWVLVGAKMITCAIVGFLYALACVALEVVIGFPWLHSKGYEVSFSSPNMLRALLSVLLLVSLFTIVGMGFGALVRNQIVAVSVGVVFLLILNNLLSIIPGVKDAFPYTPDGALQSMFTIYGSRTTNGVTLLPYWGGVLVLALWAFVPAIIGAQLTMTRDIT